MHFIGVGDIIIFTDSDCEAAEGWRDDITNLDEAAIGILALWKPQGLDFSAYFSRIRIPWPL